MRNNRIIVDINKAQYAWFGYQNQHGNKSPTKPIFPTVHGQIFNPDAPAFMSGNKTMIEVATSKGILDVWIPYCTLQLTANHRLTYTGDKALTIWKAWNEKIFKRNK